MKPPRTVAQVLTEARARYAAAPSHVPSNEMPVRGTVCVLTAIGGHPGAIDRFRAAAGNPFEITEWNAEHTTEEVLATFDAAILAEEART